MPEYTGINHLALATGDMEATIRYWRDLVGLRLVAGVGRPGYRQYFFEISDLDMLAFFEWEDAEPVPEKDHGFPVRGPVVFDHVSLGVVSDKDLWELKTALEAAGFWASELVDHGFIHSLYSFDPNGMAVEFSAPVPGVDLRRAPRMNESAPGPAAMEGPEPQSGQWPRPKESVPPEDRVVYPGEGTEFLDPSRNKWGGSGDD